MLDGTKHTRGCLPQGRFVRVVFYDMIGVLSKKRLAVLCFYACVRLFGRETVTADDALPPHRLVRHDCDHAVTDRVAVGFKELRRVLHYQALCLLEPPKQHGGHKGMHQLAQQRGVLRFGKGALCQQFAVKRAVC